jgi:DNA helicase-2/ATP-dependent DNA helicase PcrA
MWQNDKSPEAQGRLENLKELVRSMGEFENLGGFLEHVSLVMDRDAGDADDRVNIMTLHSAKGLEFGTVFLPGWEEGLFPHQRSLDEKGRAGLEEERRLAYVGITRAKRRATISFAQNRRVHALWQSAIPSRFIDELPPNHVEVVAMATSYGGHGIGGLRPEPLRHGNALPQRQHLRHPRLAARPEQLRQGRGLKSSPKFIEGESVVTRRGQLRKRRPRLPPEIRLRDRHLRGRQQAHRDRFRMKAGEKRVFLYRQLVSRTGIVIGFLCGVLFVLPHSYRQKSLHRVRRSCW